jgi:hypothetical protein
MFALQVSGHDSSWGGPKEPSSKLKRAIQIAILLPGVALFLMPSFKLGRPTIRAPHFALPDSMKQGSVITVPADSDVSSVKLEGHSLPEVKSKLPMFLVAASSVPQLDLVLNYKAPDKKISLKSLLPRFEHPVYDVFNKHIKIDPAEDETSTDIVGETRVAPSTPSISPETFKRTDGLVAALCWKQPALEELPPPPARPGRRPPPKQAALTAAGPGEVIQVTSPVQGERTVLIYHGGGLYSRYYGVRDSKMHKGDRVSAGQAIATTEAGNWKKPATARWDLFLNQTELNRSSFLALSQQLCETK